jgi:S-adenosylmethionine-diacylglycerol 3-amino-3-carboxypropyl transferase
MSMPGFDVPMRIASSQSRGRSMPKIADRSAVAGRWRIEAALDVSRPSHLAFNQSWEDPRLDLEALRPGPGDRMLTVASGGCNVLHFAMTGAHVVAIDRNPAQVAFTAVKLAAAEQLTAEAFRRVFSTGRDGDGILRTLDVPPAVRQPMLLGGWFEGRGVYGLGALGWSGRQIRRWVRWCGATEHVEAAFEATSIETQAERWSEARRRMGGPLERVLLATRLPLLAPGRPGRVSREVAGGSRAVADRVGVVLGTSPAGENWFWQRLLLDEYRTALPPYLEEGVGTLGPVTLLASDLRDFLERTEPGSLDAAALLDTMHWLGPLEREPVWAALHRALRPGGRVTVRFLGAGAGAPPGLFSESILPAMDRTGCYAGASLLVAHERP